MKRLVALALLAEVSREYDIALAFATTNADGTETVEPGFACTTSAGNPLFASAKNGTEYDFVAQIDVFEIPPPGGTCGVTTIEQSCGGGNCPKVMSACVELSVTPSGSQSLADATAAALVAQSPLLSNLPHSEVSIRVAFAEGTCDAPTTVLGCGYTCPQSLENATHTLDVQDPAVETLQGSGDATACKNMITACATFGQ